MQDGRETVVLGCYPQTAEGESRPVEWIVLAEDAGRQLLISRLCLICCGYCDDKKARDDLKYLEWEHSVAREACERFYREAFSDEERRRIVPRIVTDPATGSRVTDSVFLLSEEEATRYLPTGESRLAAPSEYAVKQGARLGWGGFEHFTGWWLLPQVENHGGKILAAGGKEYPHGMIYPKAVFHNGEIGDHGRNIYRDDFTVRPCVLVRTDGDRRVIRNA